MTKRKSKDKPFRLLREFFHHVVVVIAAAGLMLAFFLILPLMQTLARPPQTDLLIGQSVDIAKLEAPEPPPQMEPEEEPEQEEQPPELMEEMPLLDLSQLELALNVGPGDGLVSGDFTVNLQTFGASDSSDVDALFSIADLDQKPRVISQPGPTLTAAMRRKAPGKVYIAFVVDHDGRVTDPIVQRSSDPVFEQAALNSVKQWKFEPGKRNGMAVRFRMRVPMTFPQG
ncbi:MAG TPA: energy transducer TonB [Sedimentisphaerales bacterium]|nr:energy transducer TonB [Sedimentisphaerales bacterium]